MGKAPADQFYWGDWLNDVELQAAETVTRGVWINALCRMWYAKVRGELTGSAEKLAGLCGCTNDEMALFLKEIQTHGFGDIETHDNGNITIRNRRMIKAEEVKRQNRVRQRRFADKGGGAPENWTAIRVKILERDDYMCAYCGKKATTVDHLIPKTKGGTEDDDNLVSCCKSCNTIKGNRTVKDAGFKFYKHYKYNEKQLSNANITRPSSSSPSSSTSNTKEQPTADPFKGHYSNQIETDYVKRIDQLCEWLEKRHPSFPYRFVQGNCKSHPEALIEVLGIVKKYTEGDTLKKGPWAMANKLLPEKVKAWNANDTIRAHEAIKRELKQCEDMPILQNLFKRVP